jgi:Putative prokaryotic signal transducing protein
MKKIVTVRNSSEAYLLVEALRQEGIAASVQGESGVIGSIESPSVWIENDEDAERANALVAEITPKPSTEPKRRSPAFVVD